jgi:hypothetical protein
MRVTQFLPDGTMRSDNLRLLITELVTRREALAKIPVSDLLELFDDFARRLLEHPETRQLDGVAFLSSWLRRSNLESMLKLNLGGSTAFLDGFQPTATSLKLAAKPRGLVSMWMAGNVPTLPLFSIVPALLAKNVCLAKLAAVDNESAMPALLRVLAESSAARINGRELLSFVAVVHFHHEHRDLNDAMSLAADAKIMWGGAAALEAISALPRQEHCTEIAFGPKYSIGMIDRKRVEQTGDGLDRAIAAFVRDIAAFDQRACSAPQTIFVERNSRLSLRQVGEIFAAQFRRLPQKQGLDFFTTTRIVGTRAAWALDAERDVIASGPEANWTVCMDRDLSLKEAIQSRTVFVTEVGSWREILPLLSAKVQSIGIAFAEQNDAEEFAGAATERGVARCIRPGLMNGFESPWDGKLLVSEVVRWVSLKS